MNKKRLGILVMIGLWIALVVNPLIIALGMEPGKTYLVSMAPTMLVGNGTSSAPSISSDANYIAFQSAASDLVSGDTNDKIDIFVFNRQTGSMRIVSRASGYYGMTTPANGDSRFPQISGNGRYVAFESDASNLLSFGDTNSKRDIFVRDIQENITRRVSVSSSGAQANNDSFQADISNSGNHVVFASAASNLVSGDTNNVVDIFVRNLQTNETKRVSVSSSGQQADGESLDPSISADGRYVVFKSAATNLVSGDTNGKDDIFFHDLGTGQTHRVSVSSSGEQGNDGSTSPEISELGRFVSFSSVATNLVSNDTNARMDVFVHDMVTRTTERVSLNHSGGQSNEPAVNTDISDTGRYVVFYSPASNLVLNDTNGAWDVFVRDRHTNTTYRVSISLSGVQGNDNSLNGAISGNGYYVTFNSRASNFWPLDENGEHDVFIHMTVYAPAPTPTPTHTRTPTPTLTLTSTATPTHTSTPVASATHTSTPVASPTHTSTPVASATHTSTPVTSPTHTLTPTVFSTYTPTAPTSTATSQPNLPKVLSINRLDPSPTDADIVHFQVAFSKAVTGVDLSDFLLITTGALSEASVVNVSGSGDNYTVTVYSGSGNGTLRLDIPAGVTIQDENGNPLAGLPFTSGESYKIERLSASENNLFLPLILHSP